MQFNAERTVPSPAEHVVTAKEAIEPLYERVELEAEARLLAAAVQSGWSAEEAALAVARLKLEDALSTIQKLE